MSNPTVLPEILAMSATDTVVTETFSDRKGSVIIENLDNTNPVWVTWDGSAPVASFGAGRYQLNAGKSLCLNYEDILVVKGITTVGLTVEVQLLGYPTVGERAST